MTATTTGIDTFASILIFVLLVLSGFALLGTGILMAIGAVFSKRPLVTSWPTEQEHTFAAFEDRSAKASATAWGISIAGAVLLTFIAVGVYVGVTPEHHDMTKDMNMSNLTKKRPSAPKPDAAPAAAKPESPPAAEAAPKGDTPAPAEAPKQ